MQGMRNEAISSVISEFSDKWFLDKDAVRYAAELITEMKNSGMNNLSVKVTGWANDGVRQTMFNKVKAVKELGGNKALTNLVTSAKDQGVTVYLDGITNYVYML